MKKRSTFTRVQMALYCLLLSAILLLISACSGLSSPGAQPNGTPSHNGGYSIIQLAIQEAHFFQSFFRH